MAENMCGVWVWGGRTSLHASQQQAIKVCKNDNNSHSKSLAIYLHLPLAILMGEL